jgi:hypothetical protein
MRLRFYHSDVASGFQSMLGLALSLLKRHRRSWLTLLLLVAFAGVQVLQVSALHDHARETVDCALCHAPVLGDDSTLDRSLNLPAAQAGVRPVVRLSAAPTGPAPSPYQGRAPPSLV